MRTTISRRSLLATSGLAVAATLAACSGKTSRSSATASATPSADASAQPSDAPADAMADAPAAQPGPAPTNMTHDPDVAGHKMNIFTTGEGTQTIVYLPGLGEVSSPLPCTNLIKALFPRLQACVH